MKPLKSLVRKEVKNLKACTHGGEVWEIHKKYGKNLGEILDFSANINPLGCPPNVVKAIKDNLWQIPIYPDDSGLDLKNAIVDHEGQIESGNIILGNGSTELIYLFAETFIKKGDKAIIPIPTFEEYARAVKKVGGKVVSVKTWSEYEFTPEKVLDKIDSETKTVFLCNPNNPTGNLIDRENVLKILEETSRKSVLLFIDEDFMDFVEEKKRFSSARMVREYQNLFVLKSFTKTFGLAGLRLGYGIACRGIIDSMSRIRTPWNVNSLALVAGTAALKDLKFLEKTRRMMKNERGFLIREFEKFKKIKVFPTNSNFILLNIEDARIKSSEIKEKLLRNHGILIRDCSSFKGLDEYYIRIAIRTRDDNEKIVNAFKKILGEYNGKS
ncbi:MAG: threonine-phosphate decarboxylase CobD [Candidatus Bathyarchaeia archaeon]